MEGYPVENEVTAENTVNVIVHRLPSDNIKMKTPVTKVRNIKLILKTGCNVFRRCLRKVV